MTNTLCESAFFGVVISLLAYELGMLLKKKFGLPIFNPLLISIAVVIVFLAVFDIDYQNYNDGAKYGIADGSRSETEAYKIELLMKQENIVAADRTTVSPALVRAEATGAPAAAMELLDGRIITGKTSDLLGSSAALLLNALKDLSGIEHDVHVLSPESIAPIQTLKTKYLGSKNPRLHTDEVLIALSATAAQSEDAQKALSCLPQLKGCQVHSSVMLSDVDRKMFQRLGCDLTCEPKFQ